LQKRGIKTFIETSGAYPLSGHWDWICLSPKKFKGPRPDILPCSWRIKGNCIQYSRILFGQKNMQSTFLPTQSCTFNPNGRKRQKITPLIIDYVKENPRWEISLQTHKYLNIP
jgi:7-carboxy-7-deazaguanine synthase